MSWINNAWLTTWISLFIFSKRGKKSWPVSSSVLSKLHFSTYAGTFWIPPWFLGKDSGLHHFTARSISSPKGMRHFVPSRCGCGRCHRSQFALGYPSDVKPSYTTWPEDLTNCWSFFGYTEFSEVWMQIWKTLTSWVLAEDACNY